jgi:hypothetical protein
MQLEIDSELVDFIVLLLLVFTAAAFILLEHVSDCRTD